jgi:endo-1,4-beta-mannosidase
MTDAHRFDVGVNYWPARTAMAWWDRFDADEVVADFHRIGDAGLRSVRVFLLWEAFQPAPDRVEGAMLERLVRVADAARDAGLGLMPTLFTGHMSGVNWIPAWAVGGADRDARFRVVVDGRVVEDGLRNWYTDETVAHAQARLARQAAEALAGHEALLAWDLGNENSNCVIPPDRTRARAWLERMAGAIRSVDGGARVTIGLHMEDLEEDRRLGPAEAAGVCDFLTMHGYPIYASWAAGPTDPHLVPFLAQLTRWLGGGAEVLFSEFGLPTGVGTPAPPLVTEDEAAGYADRVLSGLRDAGGAGAMLWCFADYAPSIWERPPLDLAPHERSFGLWRADGTPKPVVEAIGRHRDDVRRPPPLSAWIDIDRETYWDAPADAIRRLYRRYVERAEATARP